jgi:hypothetical protein
MELLVALMKLEFAAFRMGVGRARRMRWEVGRVFAGGEAVWPPMTFICDGGIHGARRCMRPRICWGIRSAVARAYIAPAEWAKIENLLIFNVWQIV